MQEFNEAARLEGLSGLRLKTALSIFGQESAYGKNTATSNRGAVGGMQILPGTFKEVADKGWNINNPLDNTRAGIRYLTKMMDEATKQGLDPVYGGAIGYYGGKGGISKAAKGIAVNDPVNTSAPTTFQYAQQVAERVYGKGDVAGNNAAPPSPTDVAARSGTRPNIAYSQAPQPLREVANTPLYGDVINSRLEELRAILGGQSKDGSVSKEMTAQQPVKPEDINYLASIIPEGIMKLLPSGAQK